VQKRIGFKMDSRAQSFTICVQIRDRVNYISHVADERGNRCTNLDEVGRAFIEYYQHFFSLPRGPEVLISV
jgi:hypothetical protein